jgi:mycofactocin glycosyltransferase
MVAAQPPSGGTIDPAATDISIALDTATRQLDDGRVLLGGSPLRVLRFSDRGAALVRRLVAGERVAATTSSTALVDRLLDGGLAHPRPRPALLGAADVTVVVPVRDRPVDDLVRSLAAELATPIGAAGAGSEATDGAGRVIVVDDGSPVPVAVPSGVRLARRDVSGGPAAARNTGWTRATTELVAFVDSDCRPEVGWLDRLLPYFNDDRMGLVAPRIVAPAHGPGEPGSRDTASTASTASSLLARYEAVRSPLDLGPAEGRIAAGTRISYVPAAALLVRRAALAETDGFDESMPVGEDVDLVWRMVDAGWRARYAPAAHVAHDHRVRPGAWLRRRFDYGTSAAPLSRRHPGALTPVAVSWWSVAAWALLASGRPRSALAVTAGTSAALARKLRALPDPVREASRLGLLGHLHAGRAICAAITRAWLPALLAASTVSRTVRRSLVAAIVVPALLERRQKRPGIDPLRWTGLVLADDAAYCAGVWWGCWRHRTLAPLVPDLRSWPGRRPTPEPDGST